VADLVCRTYASDDLPALRRLWHKAYDAASIPRREAAFRWITEGNPHAPDGAPRHLMVDGEQVAGSLGSLPIRLRVADKTLEMHFSHDLLVDPSYRGLGLGKKLVQAVEAGAPALAGGMWMTDACYALHQRVGWSAVTPFQGHRLILDARGALRRRLGSNAMAAILAPAAGAYLRIASRLPARPDRPVAEVKAFDSRSDDLFERCAHRLGLVAERHHRYLNWKYVEAPNVTYRRFLVGEPSVDAYVVTRLQRREDGHANGLIIDLLADPSSSGAFRSAVAAAVSSLGDEGAEIVYVLTTHPPFRRWLESMGFRLSPRLYTYVITGQRSLPATGDPLDPASWYLTLGDSDGDMWSGAQQWKVSREAAAPESKPAEPS
jgi:GNAT superfamily N-acetyltransferase